MSQDRESYTHCVLNTPSTLSWPADRVESTTLISGHGTSVSIRFLIYKSDKEHVLAGIYES